jgi:hypothetical protein
VALPTSFVFADTRLITFSTFSTTLFFSFFQCRCFGDTYAWRCTDQLVTAWPLPPLICTSLGFRGSYFGDGGSNADQSYWRNLILPMDVFGDKASQHIVHLAMVAYNNLISRFSEFFFANS